MKVRGIDFTSAPSRRKPITCVTCELQDDVLSFLKAEEWSSFDQFSNALEQPGPWISGIDFPFGQARRLVENIGWPRTWAGYVSHLAEFDKAAFVELLERYKDVRPAGDKEHKRVTDQRAGSLSPQKLYGVPVGKMFFEGAPRLLSAGVDIPGLQLGDPERIVVEAYPGLIARTLIGRTSYKSDNRGKQTADQRRARLLIFKALSSERSASHYRVRINAPDELAEDPSGDMLDSLLCAVQAGWAYQNRSRNFGRPSNVDPLEGWIADPALSAQA